MRPSGLTLIVLPCSLLLLAGSGCKDKDDGGTTTKTPTKTTAPSLKKSAPAPQVTIRFGDCAPGTTGFVSGKRPLPVLDPFADEAELAKKHRQVIAPKEKRTTKKKPGGTGTLMMQEDEGRMGKPDPRPRPGWSRKKTEGERGRLTTYHGGPFAMLTGDSGRTAPGRKGATRDPHHEPKPPIVQTPEKPYRPGTHNPLVARAAGVTACLTKMKKLHGQFVVDLTADAKGAIVAAKTLGIGSATAEQCIASVARKATVKTSTQAVRHLRCSAAFGSRPLGGAGRRIDITPSAISVDGKTIADAQKLQDSSIPIRGVVELFAVLLQERTTRHRELRTYSAIRTHEPWVVRPAPETTSKVLNLVLATIREVGGTDVVLAARGGTTWTLLRAGLRLPEVPIPSESGAMWWQSQSFDDTGERPQSRPVLGMTIVVQPNGALAVLGTRKQVIEKFAVKGRSDAAVAELLAKVTAWRKNKLAMTTLIHITSADAVLYRDLTRVIKAVSKAGLIHWSLRPPGR